MRKEMGLSRVNRSIGIDMTRGRFLAGKYMPAFQALEVIQHAGINRFAHRCADFAANGSASQTTQNRTCNSTDG